jgi:O-antigen ligase
MSQLVRIMLWVFVFLVPWENIVVIPGLGTGAKLWGLVTGVVGLFCVLFKGKLRYHPFLLAGLLFVAWGWASVLWSIEPEQSLRRMFTYTGLWLMAWLIYHYGTEEFLTSLFQAYVLGACVAALATIQAYMHGVEVVYQRFAATGFGPNDLSFYLNLAIPFAAFLSFKSTASALKLVDFLYIPIASIAVLLTASRSGALGLAIAFLFVLYSFRVAKGKWRLAGLLLLAATAGIILTWVPQTSLARIATTVSEIHGGTLNERLIIWAAGSQVLAAHPFLGVGAGAFRQAVEPILGKAWAPHNVFLAVAVEGGIPGLILWLAFMTLPFVGVLRLPRYERRLWLVILAVLTLSFLSLNFEWRKVSWLMLAFATAYSMKMVPKGRAGSIVEQKQSLGHAL